MTAPFPAPQPQGPRVGLILGVVGLVAVLCCGGAVTGGYVFRDRLTALAGQGDSGQGDVYSRPKDVCDLLYDDMGEQAGPFSDLKPLDEGCLFTFAGETGPNELRLFVTVNDAVGRYNEAGADFGNREGFVGDEIADLGDAAFFTRRLLDGGGLVDAKLGCLSRNLYIELRLHATSKRAWSSDDVRARLTAVAQQIMQEVPRR